jgi:EpsI family protein
MMIATCCLCIVVQKFDASLLGRPVPRSSQELAATPTQSAWAPIGIALLATSFLALAPLASNVLAHSATRDAGERIKIVANPPWIGPLITDIEWRPSFGQPDTHTTAVYRSDGGDVLVYQAYVSRQTHSSEVINEANEPYDASRWMRRGGRAGNSYYSPVDGEPFTVIETRIENRDDPAERLVWHWYRVAGRDVTNPWEAKGAQIFGFLQGRTDAEVIILSAEMVDLTETRALLKNFLQSNIRPMVRDE